MATKDFSSSVFFPWLSAALPAASAQIQTFFAVPEKAFWPQKLQQGATPIARQSDSDGPVEVEKRAVLELCFPLAYDKSCV